MAVEINITPITRSVSINAYSGLRGTDGVGVVSGGTTGQVLAKASATDYDTEWIDISSDIIVVKKTIDETKANDNTPSLDSELLYPLLANKSYYFEITFFYSGSSAYDLSYTFELPTDCELNRVSSTFTASSNSLVNESTITNVPILAGQTRFVTSFGYLNNNSNIGNFGLKWSQQTSGPIGSIIHKNSILKIININ